MDLPEANERTDILKIHLSRRSQDMSNFDIAQLVEATEGFSGAEIEQVVITTHYRALYEQRPAKHRSAGGRD